MGSCFGFVQLELPGRVGLDDGRYLDRGPGGPFVLAVETEAAIPPVRRKRRNPRREAPDRGPAEVPVTVATVVFAGEPFPATEAGDWLRTETGETQADRRIETALQVLERGLAVAAATTGRVIGAAPAADRALAIRIGYGEGEKVYDGRYLEAIGIDPGDGGRKRRRQRLERILPLGRIAAVLAGREPVRACEVLVPRVRADLDAGRIVPAALTVGEAARATLAELDSALEDPEHEADLDRLEELLPALLALPVEVLGGNEAADAATPENLDRRVRPALELIERVIRRYRITSQ